MTVENRRNLGPAYRRPHSWREDPEELWLSVLPPYQLSQKLESILVLETIAICSEQMMRQR